MLTWKLFHKKSPNFLRIYKNNFRIEKIVSPALTKTFSLTFSFFRAFKVKMSKLLKSYFNTPKPWKHAYSKVAKAKILSYIFAFSYSELLSIIAHCSLKVNMKINFLFPMSILSTLVSSLSFLTSLFFVLSSLSLLWLAIVLGGFVDFVVVLQRAAGIHGFLLVVI